MPPEAIVDAVREGRTDELPAAVREVAAPSEARFLLERRLPETAQPFLIENPEHPRARLERYLLLTYAAGSDARAVLEALRSDEYVEYAYSSSPGDDGSEPPPPGDPGGEGFPAPPWHVDLMRFGAAWSMQVGWTMISAIDNGIEEAHPEFVSVDPQTNSYVGGNFIKELSRNILIPGNGPFKYVDEKAECVSDPAIQFGHGTHIAGLMSAKQNPSGNCPNCTGACPSCGLAVAKLTRCIGGQNQLRTIDDLNLINALTHVTVQGAAVTNLSFGFAVRLNPNPTSPIRLSPGAHRYGAEISTAITLTSTRCV